MSVLPRPFSSETGLPDRALVRSRDRRRPFPRDKRYSSRRSSAARSCSPPNARWSCLQTASGKVLFLWYLPTSPTFSVRLQRRFRSSYLIGIVKKNAIMIINFGPRRRAQPGPDSCRRCLLPCVFLAAASYPYVLAVFVVVYRACPNDRPNHVGIAVQRHLRTGRIQERDGKLYSISPAT